MSLKRPKRYTFTNKNSIDSVMETRNCTPPTKRMACSVAWCPSEHSITSGQVMFALPINEVESQKWMDILGISPMSNILFVCGSHFEDDSFIPGSSYRKLKPNVLPSRNFFSRSPDSNQLAPAETPAEEILCRACKIECKHDHKSLWISENRILYESSTGLVLTLTKDLPDTICLKCLRTFRDWLDFKKQCQETNHFFLDKLPGNSRAFDPLQISNVTSVKQESVVEIDEEICSKRPRLMSLESNKSRTSDLETDHNEAGQQQCLQEIKNLKHELQGTMSAGFAQILASIDSLHEVQSYPNQPPTTSTTNSIFKIENFNKIKSQDDAVTLDNRLKNTAFQTEMVQKLAYIVGKEGRRIGDGWTCCYELTDAFFERQFLAQCSWTGASTNKSSDGKIAFKNLPNIIECFATIIINADPTHDLSKTIEFFKKLLRNATRFAKQEHSQSRKSVKRSKLTSKKTVCSDKRSAFALKTLLENESDDTKNGV